MPLLARQYNCRAPAPVAGQGNLSTDAGMILLRTEGWKEVKPLRVRLEASFVIDNVSDNKTRLV